MTNPSLEPQIQALILKIKPLIENENLVVAEAALTACLAVIATMCVRRGWQSEQLAVDAFKYVYNKSLVNPDIV